MRWAYIDMFILVVFKCNSPVMRDDVTLSLVTSKRDLMVKISREFKRNIVHVGNSTYVRWRHKVSSPRQSEAWWGSKPGCYCRFVDFSFRRISNRHARYALYSSWISVKSSPPSLVLMLSEKNVTSSPIRAIRSSIFTSYVLAPQPLWIQTSPRARTVFKDLHCNQSS